MLDSFMDKVSPEPNTGCWLWTGGLSAAGYGIHGNHTYAHRTAYEMLIGKIPEGLCIDHLCRVRSCVNPAHMEPVTRGENVRRGLTGSLSKARAAAQTHCVNGHEFTPENTLRYRVRKYVSRRCSACNAIRCKKYRETRHVSG